MTGVQTCALPIYIPVLCTVLDPVFKFIAKGELLKVPCIGQQLEGVSAEILVVDCQCQRILNSVPNPFLCKQGNHILIDREDRRSQLRTFKEGINWLKNGVPIMAFPEGQRSQDGRLIDFKGGLFSMAAKTGVPIVPLTLSHTHAVYPSNALFPVQQGEGKLHVHVHEPIESKGRTDAELAEMVRKAFLSELPLDHLPADMDQDDLIASSAVESIKVEAASSTHHSETPTVQHIVSNEHQQTVSVHQPQEDNAPFFVKEKVAEKL